MKISLNKLMHEVKNNLTLIFSLLDSELPMLLENKILVFSCKSLISAKSKAYKKIEPENNIGQLGIYPKCIYSMNILCCFGVSPLLYSCVEHR